MDEDCGGGAGLATLPPVGDRLEIGGVIRSSQDLEEADFLWSSSLLDP